VRPDPNETLGDSKLTGFWMILDRVIKYWNGWVIGWRMAVQTVIDILCRDNKAEGL
jgi:hypothetical protein